VRVLDHLIDLSRGHAMLGDVRFGLVIPAEGADLDDHLSVSVSRV